MKVGIIVPFYEGYKYLDRLLESVERAAKGMDCTVFIIDNSPRHIPIQKPAFLKIPVEIIRERPGIGYGKACNAGYALCKKEGFDYILISNQDGYFSEGIIQGLLQPFEKDASVMVSAPLLKIYGQEEIEDFFIKYYLSQTPALVSDLFSGRTKEYYELEKISGACFAFSLRNPKYAFDYLFDPLFHMYFEDEDLCQRVRLIKGKMVMVVEESIFYHQHSHTNDMENQEVIKADKLISEKILHLKNVSKSMVKTLYGIFVSTFTIMLFHLLRGELRSLYLHFRSLVITIFLLPRIRKSYKLELLISTKK